MVLFPMHSYFSSQKQVPAWVQVEFNFSKERAALTCQQLCIVFIEESEVTVASSHLIPIYSRKSSESVDLKPLLDSHLLWTIFNRFWPYLDEQFLKACTLKPVISNKDYFPTKSSFQERVLNDLLSTGWAELTCYSDMAIRLGSHPRAVARALATNCFPLIFPCHRVVPRNYLGRESNFYGGYREGANLKRQLIEFERGLDEKYT